MERRHLWWWWSAAVRALHFRRPTFILSRECPRMCFWFQVMTLPKLYLDKVSIRWNIGCLFYLRKRWKRYIWRRGVRPLWQEEADRDRCSSRPPTGSGVSTKKEMLMRERLSLAAHFPMRQQNIQMKKFTQTGLTAREVSQLQKYAHDSVEGFDSMPALASGGS